MRCLKNEWIDEKDKSRRRNDQASERMKEERNGMERENYRKCRRNRIRRDQNV